MSALSDSSDHDEGGWTPLSTGPEPGRVAMDHELSEVSGAVRVVGLGAMCDLHRISEDGRSISFWVSEFALLDDGRRLILHSDRGYTTAWGANVLDTPDLSTTLTRESITHEVLNVVLPDDDTGEDHPWEWLAGLARSRGASVTSEDLRELPYEVILGDSVVQLLSTGRSARTDRS